MRRVLGIVAAAAMVLTGAVATPAEAAYQVPTPDDVRTVRTTGSTMTLDWTVARGSSGYRVKVSRSRLMTNPQYVRFRTSSGTVTGLRPNRRYHVAVAALGDGSRRVSRYTAAPYPSAVTQAVDTPAGLIAGTASTSTVDLSWTPTAGAELYRISISPDADFSATTRLRSSSPRATVRSLDSDTRYYFRLKAIHLDGSSASGFGNTVAARTEAESSSPPASNGGGDGDPVVDGPANVRVGSYNVQSVSLDKLLGERHPWADRRDGVLGHILGQDLDVLGIQEANPSNYFASRLLGGTNQFLDIRNGLVAGGQPMELTNSYSANCRNGATTYLCVPQDRGATGSDRILYNTDRLDLVRQGGQLYTTQDPLGNPRHLAWAVLRVKRTGEEFLFTTTHLEQSSESVRRKQWLEMISLVKQLRGSLPVISVGDYNVQKFSPLAEEMLPRMKALGMPDVLNQEYRVNPTVGGRARTRVNAWVNSYNHLDRNLAHTSYEDRRDKTGNGIDWIFASTALAVPQYEVVVDYDPSTLRFNGIIPSDHNMVAATITLP